MSDFLSNWWSEIASRPSGPMAMRFYLQPLIAMLLATRDGLGDARHRRPAWLFAVATDRGHRRDLLANGWKTVGKVFLVAVGLDVAYQVVVLHAFRPGQTLFVAAVLALIPYALLRGPVNRLARRGRTASLKEA